MFLLVPAYPGCPGSKAVKRSLLLLLLPTLVVTHQLQVERRTGKVCQPETDVLPLCHATSRYQKGKTNLDFTEARDSEWQWHQLGHVQVCTSLQTENHASIPPLTFLRAKCPSCRPTNSVKALEEQTAIHTTHK